MGSEGQAGRPCPPPQPRSPRAALPRPGRTGSQAEPPQDAQQAPLPPGCSCRRKHRAPAARSSCGAGGRRGGRKPPLASPQGAGPWGSPSPLTQEGDAGVSCQLLAASLGEDVGALLGHRDTGSTCFFSARGGRGWLPTPATSQDSPSSGGRQSRSCSPQARSPAAPPSCRRSAPASRPPRTPPGGQERGGGGRWVPRKQPRWARRAGRLPRGEGALREQYLGCGDHEGPQGTVGAQGVHHGHVLIRGPWGRVHNQVVQLPPGHVGHKLLYQRCGDPGRLGVGGSEQVGRVSPGPHSLLAPGRGDLWVLGPLAFGELCVPLCARGETLPQPPRTLARALASMAGVGTLRGGCLCPREAACGECQAGMAWEQPLPRTCSHTWQPRAGLRREPNPVCWGRGIRPLGRTRQLKASWLWLTLSLPRPTVCVLAGLMGRGVGERLRSEEVGTSLSPGARGGGAGGAPADQRGITVLPGASPHQSLVWLLQQEAHRHEGDALLPVHEDGHPATVALVHRPALHSEHAGDAGATQVHVQDPHLLGASRRLMRGAPAGRCPA